MAGETVRQWKTAEQYLNAAVIACAPGAALWSGGEPIIRTCDGQEQDAFEAWAAAQRMDVQTHPLHWLFLDPKTAAARQGWRAATEYWAKRASSGENTNVPPTHTGVTPE